MVVFERQQTIMKYLKEKRFATVKELSGVVFASEASVRRDVKALEAKGLLKQIYGGVVLSEYENSVVPVRLRESSNSVITSFRRDGRPRRRGPGRCSRGR